MRTDQPLENEAVEAVNPERDGCCGCFACYNVCPSSTICMNLTADGFYEPVVDAARCTGCGLCASLCPVLRQHRLVERDNMKAPSIYAAWSTDETTRCSSSSGGVFSALAQHVLNEGGAVVGCVWGDNWTPEHRIARNLADVVPMRGSKYVPSYVGRIYRDALEFVRSTNRPLLFSGTPCQIAALQGLADDETLAQITTCEVICHGVPSLRVFHAYLDSLFDGERIEEFTFRSKAFGWISPFARSESGREYNVPLSQDAFLRGFLPNLFLKKTCYNCWFQRLPRRADITLGDFWGIRSDLYDKRGVSLVAVNNEKAEYLLQSIGENGHIELHVSDIRRAVAKNPRLVLGRYRTIPPSRRKLLDDFKRGMDVADLVEKHYPSYWRRQFDRVLNKAWRMASLKVHGF